MKPANLSTVLRRTAMRVLVSTVVAILFVFPSLANAQQKSDHSKKDSASTATNSAAEDNEYSKKIKEYTTQTYFRTEYVDHLPMSDKVPSPDKVLGYVVGT